MKHFCFPSAMNIHKSRVSCLEKWSTKEVRKIANKQKKQYRSRRATFSEQDKLVSLTKLLFKAIVMRIEIVNLLFFFLIKIGNIFSCLVFVFLFCLEKSIKRPLRIVQSRAGDKRMKSRWIKVYVCVCLSRIHCLEKKNGTKIMSYTVRASFVFTSY